MLGSNVPTVGGFSTAFITADKWGCECIQIYLTPSRRWVIPKLQEHTIQEFKKYWRDSLVQEVVSHVPFLVNLASSKEDLWKKSIERVCVELEHAQKFGVPLVDIHLGSSGNRLRSRGISRIIKALDIIFQKQEKFCGHLLIETMAGQGSMIGSSFKEIADILAKVEASEKMGVCLDTAHIFAAGYDIRGYDGYWKVLQKFDEIVGIDRIKAIHLNDSKSELGSQIDRHANIGKGKIGLQTFHAIMRDERFSTTPKIIEVPQRDMMSEESLNLLRDLQNSSQNVEEKRQSLGQLTLEEVVVWKKRKK